MASRIINLPQNKPQPLSALDTIHSQYSQQPGQGQGWYLHLQSYNSHDLLCFLIEQGGLLRPTFCSVSTVQLYTQLTYLHEIWYELSLTGVFQLRTFQVAAVLNVNMTVAPMFVRYSGFSGQQQF
jgi:hypothetical protein